MSRGDSTDWSHWHSQYDVTPDLQTRLAIVQEQLVDAMAQAPPGPIRLVSLCAGDGRDVIAALQHHPRRLEVEASLVELDHASVLRGRAVADRVGLTRQVRFVEADATRAASYGESVPASVVLASGMLGHLRPRSVARLILNFTLCCREGGSLIWNRHHRLNDGIRQVPAIRRWLACTGFHEVDYRSTSPDGFACGRCRFDGPARIRKLSSTLFEFVGLSVLDPSGTGTTSVAFGLHQKPNQLLDLP